MSNLAFTQHSNNSSSKTPETSCLCRAKYKTHGVISNVVDMSIATSEHFMKRFCHDAVVEALVSVLSSQPKLVCSINGRSSRLMLAPPLVKMAMVKPALLQKPTLTLATR